MEGKFIVFEGANGVGKSTVIERVSSFLVENGRHVFCSKEPSDTELGLLVREYAETLSGKPLACLVAADRISNMDNVVNPKVNEGFIVLSDRGILSAYVYNKIDGVDFDYTKNLYQDMRYPDIIIMLRPSEETRITRLKSRSELTRYERENFELENRLYEDGTDYLSSLGVNTIVISSDSEVEETVDDVLSSIEPFL